MSLEDFKLGFAEAGAAEGDAMHRRMLLQPGVEIRLRDHVGKFDEIDVVPRVKQRSSRCDIDPVTKIFFLLVAFLLPLSAIAPSKDDAGHLV